MTHFLDVKKTNIRYLNVFLYIWIILTIVISMVDLTLFILFILDYDRIMRESFESSLNFAVATSSIFVTAQNTSGMLASLALRGYLLWFVNIILAVYLFTQTFQVFDYNRMSQIRTGANSGQVNKGFSNDTELQGHAIYKNPPIKAFGDTQ